MQPKREVSPGSYVWDDGSMLDNRPLESPWVQIRGNLSEPELFQLNASRLSYRVLKVIFQRLDWPATIQESSLPCSRLRMCHTSRARQRQRRLAPLDAPLPAFANGGRWLDIEWRYHRYPAGVAHSYQSRCPGCTEAEIEECSLDAWQVYAARNIDLSVGEDRPSQAVEMPSGTGSREREQGWIGPDPEDMDGDISGMEKDQTISFLNDSCKRVPSTRIVLGGMESSDRLGTATLLEEHMAV